MRNKAEPRWVEGWVRATPPGPWGGGGVGSWGPSHGCVEEGGSPLDPPPIWSNAPPHPAKPLACYNNEFPR